MTSSEDSDYCSASENDGPCDHPQIKKLPPSWKRKRIDSVEEDSGYNAMDNLRYFRHIHPNLDTDELIDLYAQSDVASTPIVNQLMATKKKLEADGTKVRFGKLINAIEHERNMSVDRPSEEGDGEEEDEGEDEDEGGEDGVMYTTIPTDISSLLFTLFNRDLVNETVAGDTDHTNAVSRFKSILTSVTSNSNDKQESTLAFFKSLKPDTQEHYLSLITEMKAAESVKPDTPYLLELAEMNIDTSTKNHIFDQVVSFQKMNSSTSEYAKKRNLIKTIQSLPLGKLATQPADLAAAVKEFNDNTPSAVPSKKRRLNKPVENSMATYINNVKERLDRVIYGHHETKNQTLRLISSIIANGSSKGGNCFAIEGPPGVGKTQIAGEIARALGRPYMKINMGGANSGDDLVGHGYTYEGSTPGRIAYSLIDSKCMNPVLMFDELDKVSQTHKGNEINNILLHITDDAQNSNFADKYLAGINLDLSGALMIFTFNDRHNISPILLDRMKIIHVDGYKLDDKIVIAEKHLIPAIQRKLGYPTGDYTFENNVLRDIINQYTFEGGVRKLKQLLTDIIMEVNLRKMTGAKIDDVDSSGVNLITKQMIKNDIFKDKMCIQHTMISDVDQVGLVNGLWANTYGVGGVIPIQAHIIPTPTKFELQLTGMQGDVMKESMLVAKTVAWELLSVTRQNELMKDWKKTGPSGVHIHCPDGATPKDGPSAGCAITTCLVSLLTHTKVRQNVAMTGEINLKGEITAIGGLEEKIFGAITAGVTTILYPVENQRDADKILTKYPRLREQHNIELIPVSKIEEVLDKVLLQIT